jgi:type I restriction enzyme S subunit
MDLKPGYRQTEVGVIPEEWQVISLGRMGRWLSGGTPGMANPSYWGGEIPL